MFRFSDFSLSDSRCGQKICSDAVLFGVWAWKDMAPCEKTENILDIGAGSGLLSLLSARSRPNSRITALEIDPDAALDATENFHSSPWVDRITLVEGDFSQFLPATPVDAIICNPPFFSGGGVAPEKSRALARHEASLSYESVAAYAARHLKRPGGRLLLLAPADRGDSVVFACELAGLKLRRSCQVSTTPAKAPTRLMLEFSISDGPISSENISIRNPDGKYTAQYLGLVGNIYHHLTC